MITFTDERLYVKGTCSATLTDKSTGDIKYFSDKFQTANITTEVSAEPIRAGLGNGIAAIIPSDSALNVDFSTADFNLYAKIAQVGGTLNYNAPAMTCQVVTASTTDLKVDVTDGIPVAQLGFSEVHCYVQEVGAASPIGVHGVAYPITAEGAVTGFTAAAGKKYKVWFCVNKASARVGTVPSFIDPAVYHFTSQMAVYANKTGGSKNGTRVGWLYAIIPSLKLSGTGGGVVGDQTTADTTSISGQAIISDSEVVSETCDDCGGGGNVYAYYIYVPDDGAEAIAGLAIVGGVVSLPVSTTAQIPVKFVMENGELVTPNYAELTYEMKTAIEGTTVSAAGVITAGSTAGEGDLQVTYSGGKKPVSTMAAVSVTAAGG